MTIFIPLYFLIAYVFIRYKRGYCYVKNRENRFEKRYVKKMLFAISSKKLLDSSDFDLLFDSKIKKLNKKEKRVISRMLSSIYERASFFNDKNNQNLLEYLNLSLFWEKKLTYGNIMQKHDSLRRFDDLRTRISSSVLSRLTYDRNVFLRKRCRSIYLRSTPNDPFRFFEDNFDKDLNTWDKIDIHNALEKRSRKGELPNLIRWVLRSENIGFQCFLVNEVAFFNQQENYQVLRNMITNTETNPLLKEACINALGKMRCKDIEPDLVKIYDTQPQNVQICIIMVIGNLDTRESLSFLTDVYKETVGDEKKMQILSVIYKYGNEGQNVFYALKEKETSKDPSSLIFEHVSNPLLSI